MSTDSALQHLVLNVCQGFHFDCLKNVLLRVSATFQNERLTSNYVRSSPEPIFNFNFSWCTTGRHIARLQEWSSPIQIQISATSSEQTWTVGYATLGIQDAQMHMGRNNVLNTQRLVVGSMQTKIPIALRPELLVTLSIRSEPLLEIGCRLYSANLSEMARPLNPSSRIVPAPTSSTVAATTEQGRQSQSNRDLLSKYHELQKQKTTKSVRGLLELDRNNNRGEISSSTSSTAAQKKILKFQTLSKEMEIPPNISVTTQNIYSKIEQMGLYDSTSQMVSQPPLTRTPEVPVSKIHNRIPATQKNLDEPSTSFSPVVEDIHESETELRIVKYATGSINLRPYVPDVKNEEIEIEKLPDQTFPAPTPATCALKSSASRTPGPISSTPLRKIFAPSTKPDAKVKKKTVRFK